MIKEFLSYSLYLLGKNFLKISWYELHPAYIPELAPVYLSHTDAITWNYIWIKFFFILTRHFATAKFISFQHKSMTCCYSDRSFVVKINKKNYCLRKLIIKLFVYDVHEFWERIAAIWLCFFFINTMSFLVFFFFELFQNLSVLRMYAASAASF